MKQGLAKTLKAIAIVAACVCILAPITTGTGFLAFVISLFVAIIAGVTGHHLDDNDQSGYWPSEPNSAGHPTRPDFGKGGTHDF